MQDSASNARRGDGRWCSRVLLVLGGAVAGTAAAWALSAATASASPAEESDAVVDTGPVVALVAGADEAVGVVSDALDVVGDSFPRAESEHSTSDGAPAPRDEPAASEAADSGAQPEQGSLVVDELVRRAALRPAVHTMRSVARLVHEAGRAPRVIAEALDPADELREFAERVGAYFAPGSDGERSPLPASPADRSVQDSVVQRMGSSSLGVGHGGRAPSERAAPPPGTKPELSALSHSVAWTDLGAIRAGGRAGSGPSSAPATLRGAAPITPYLAGSGVGAAHLDGLQFGFSAAPLSAFDAAAVGFIRPVSRTLLVQPQPQPGVTPD